jgi:hypothetical protein
MDSHRPFIDSVYTANVYPVDNLPQQTPLLPDPLSIRLPADRRLSAAKQAELQQNRHLFRLVSYSVE